MLSGLKDCSKVNILKNLIDCSEKSSTLCAIDKTKQKLSHLLYMKMKSLHFFVYFYQSQKTGV